MTAADSTATAAHAEVGREQVETLVIGSGFAGLAMAVALERDGVTDFVVLERGDDVGGTWRDNTYPGAACDVPSHLYSLSFAPNAAWTRSFSDQPEIQAYLRRVADEHGVRPHLRTGTTVTEARWDEHARRWEVDTDRGGFTACFLINGGGALSDPALPRLRGLESFSGAVFHSARWDHGHDLAGERVAVIGTGASAVQLVPQIQPVVGRLAVFQRTPPWVIPRRDRAITRLERAAYSRVPVLARLTRQAIYWGRETFAYAFTRDTRLLRLPEALARRHIKRGISDPALRTTVTPDYTLGCKRVLISNDYYPALDQPNVEVVTTGIDRVTSTGIVDGAGVEHDLDTIVFATGFTTTDLPLAHHIRGVGGTTLAERWCEGMVANRGTTVDGFPNFFLLVGPNTGLGHSSQVFMIEQQVGYVSRLLAEVRRAGSAVIEVRREAVEEHTGAVRRRMERTVWTTGGCSSWYLDAQGHNTTLWPSFTFTFRSALAGVDLWSYRLDAPAPADVVTAGR